jgi:hypothetical protein
VQAHAAAQAEKRESPDKFYKNVKSRVGGNMKSIKTTQKRVTREAGPRGVKIGHQYEMDSTILNKYENSRSHKDHIDSLSVTIQAKMNEMENMKNELNNSPWKQRKTVTVTTKSSTSVKEIADIHAESLRRSTQTVHHENYVNYQKDIDDCKKALNCLSKADISEMKSLNHPPATVKVVVDVLSVLFGGELTWEAGKKMFADADKFINALKNYDATCLSPSDLQKANEMLADLSYDSCVCNSKACGGLFVWAWNICKIRSMILGQATA